MVWLKKAKIRQATDTCRKEGRSLLSDDSRFRHQPQPATTNERGGSPRQGSKLCCPPEENPSVGYCGECRNGSDEGT